MKNQSTPSLWPNSNRGLSLGWQGAAWVSLQLQFAGINNDPKGKIEKAIVSKLELFVSEKVNAIEVSPFAGNGADSIICTLAVLNNSLEKRFQRKVLRKWTKQCLNSQLTDVVMGHAGVILGCAEIERNMPGSIDVKFIAQIWQSVQSAAENCLNNPRSQLLGFSHGLAGYIYALETGHHVFGLKAKKNLISKCGELLWSNRVVDKKASLWSERVGEKNVGIHGWCHGAPGIALSYLGCYLLTGSDLYKTRLKSALLGTISKTSSEAENFCCGKIGRAQVLIEAYRHLKDERYLRNAQILRQDILKFNPVGRFSRSFFFGSLGKRYLDYRIKNWSCLPMPGFGYFSYYRVEK